MTEIGCSVPAVYPHLTTAEDAAEYCDRLRASLPNGYFHRASPAVADACHREVVALIGEPPALVGEPPDGAAFVQMARYQERYAATLCELPVCPPGKLGVELWVQAEFTRRFAERVTPGGIWAAGERAPPMTEAELAAVEAALEDAEWAAEEAAVRFWAHHDRGAVPGDYARARAAEDAFVAHLVSASSDINVAEAEDEADDEADDSALDDADDEDH